MGKQSELKTDNEFDAVREEISELSPNVKLQVVLTKSGTQLEVTCKTPRKLVN